MDTQRTVLKIDKNNPGTEVAAETAAALASASLVFRKTDPNYSKVLLKRAIRVPYLTNNQHYIIFNIKLHLTQIN